MTVRIKSFRIKLNLFEKKFHAGNSAHFSTLHSLGEVENQSLKEYADMISNFRQQFDSRFSDFKGLEPHFQLFSPRSPLKLKLLQKICRWNWQIFNVAPS